MIRFLIAVIVFNLVEAKLPPGFSVCKKSDINYNECMIKAVENSIGSLENGNKGFKLPKLSPLFVKDIHIPGNGGNVDLNQTFYDLEVTGFSKIKINQFDSIIDNNKCQIDFDGVFENVQMAGSYKIDGKLLVFQLKGFGALNLTIGHLATKHTISCKINGDFLKIIDYQLTLRPNKLYIDIENLINGNEELSKRVLKLVNENAVEIFEEVRKDYERTFAEIFKQLATSVFTKIPIKDIF